MSKEKVHIDHYFKEKVSTQKVEGEVPSFDAMVSQGMTSNPKPSKAFYTKKGFYYIFGGFTVLCLTFYFGFLVGRNVPTTTKQGKAKQEINIREVEGIPKEKNAQEEKFAAPVVEKNEPVVSTHSKVIKETPSLDLDNHSVTEPVEIMETSEQVEDLLPDEEEKIEEVPGVIEKEEVVEVETPEVTEEKRSELDLFMNRNTEEGEKGNPLFKKN